MKILFISDNFPPEVNAPASRTYEHCIEWARAGHAVTIITCAPNFPAGKVFDGYRNRLRQVEEIEGLRVVRVWSFISANEGFALRILDYLSFMFSAVIASLFERRPDVVIGTSPQFFAACGAWLAAKLRRRPFVFELRDLWPESIKAVGAMKDSWALRQLERLEMFLYRQASLIVAVTHGFKSNLAARGIDPDKITVVTNGVDLSRFQPRPRDDVLLEALGLRGKFVVGYIGTLGMAHALENVIAAAEQLRDRPDVRILFVGPGAVRESLIAECAKRRVDNVIFVPGQPKDRVSLYWDLCDVALVHLKNAAVFATVIPSKIFEAMAMGLPIVLAAPTGEASAIVARNGAGVVVPPEDPAALAATIRDLHDDDASRARYAESSARAAPLYTRQEQARRVMEVLVAAAS